MILKIARSPKMNLISDDAQPKNGKNGKNGVRFTSSGKTVSGSLNHT